MPRFNKKFKELNRDEQKVRVLAENFNILRKIEKDITDNLEQKLIDIQKTRETLHLLRSQATENEPLQKEQMEKGIGILTNLEEVVEKIKQKFSEFIQINILNEGFNVDDIKEALIVFAEHLNMIRSLRTQDEINNACNKLYNMNRSLKDERKFLRGELRNARNEREVKLVLQKNFDDKINLVNIEIQESAEEIRKVKKLNNVLIQEIIIKGEEIRRKDDRIKLLKSLGENFDEEIVENSKIDQEVAGLYISKKRIEQNIETTEEIISKIKKSIDTSKMLLLQCSSKLLFLRPFGLSLVKKCTSSNIEVYNKSITEMSLKLSEFNNRLVSFKKTLSNIIQKINNRIISIEQNRRETLFNELEVLQYNSMKNNLSVIEQEKVEKSLNGELRIIEDKQKKNIDNIEKINIGIKQTKEMLKLNKRKIEQFRDLFFEFKSKCRKYKKEANNITRDIEFIIGKVEILSQKVDSIGNDFGDSVKLIAWSNRVRGITDQNDQGIGPSSNLSDIKNVSIMPNFNSSTITSLLLSDNLTLLQ